VKQNVDKKFNVAPRRPPLQSPVKPGNYSSLVNNVALILVIFILVLLVIILLFLAVLESGAPLSSSLEEAIYKCSV